MLTELRKIQYEARDLAEIEVLLRRASPQTSHLDPAYMRWSYAENPEGRTLGFNAYHEGSLAAHYAGQPLRAGIDGKEERGLLSLHTATHPAYRGQGLFTQLARRTFEEARAQGYQFVVGVAHAARTPGFIGKLGGQLVCSLAAQVGVGLPRFAPAESEKELGFAKIWTPELLEWRLSCPSRRYSQRADGRYATVYAPTGQAGMLAELGSFPSAWLPARVPASRSWNPLRLWLGIESSTRIGPFFPLPASLRPAPLDLIFLDLSPRRRTLDPRRVRFQAIDFDAY